MPHCVFFGSNAHNQQPIRTKGALLRMWRRNENIARSSGLGVYAVINGAHVVVSSKDAEADRAFFRDVLQFPCVDAGRGWLIFAMPPLEVAFHDSEKNDQHELFLMCDDLAATMKDLKSK